LPTQPPGSNEERAAVPSGLRLAASRTLSSAVS